MEYITREDGELVMNFKEKEEKRGKECSYQEAVWNFKKIHNLMLSLNKPQHASAFTTIGRYQPFLFLGLSFLSVTSGAYIQKRGSIIDMDRNFVCLWRRHNCRSQVIDLSRPFCADLLIYEINYCVFKQF
jgi:hypothetical protein